MGVEPGSEEGGVMSPEASWALMFLVLLAVLGVVFIIKTINEWLDR
jgi:hypothetical protein